VIILVFKVFNGPPKHSAFDLISHQGVREVRVFFIRSRQVVYESIGVPVIEGFIGDNEGDFPIGPDLPPERHAIVGNFMAVLRLEDPFLRIQFPDCPFSIFQGKQEGRIGSILGVSIWIQRLQDILLVGRKSELVFASGKDG